MFFTYYRVTVNSEPLTMAEPHHGKMTLLADLFIYSVCHIKALGTELKQQKHLMGLKARSLTDGLDSQKGRKDTFQASQHLS